MLFFDKKEGVIVIVEQEESFEKDGSSVGLLPAFAFLKNG
jgi:hypothetical protein